MGQLFGVETAVAAAELFDVPTWAVFSTSGMASFDPTPGVCKLWVEALQFAMSRECRAARSQERQPVASNAHKGRTGSCERRAVRLRRGGAATGH